jgi:ClpP class serine protease
MWLLETDVRQRIESAVKSGFVPSADQLQQFNARAGSAGSGDSPVMSVAGDTAEIRMEGVLTKRPDFMAFLFGGGNTTYGDIISAIAQVESDDSITNIVFAFDSPGGSVDGMFDAIDAISSVTKPNKAVVHGLAASAAYALASASAEIEAASRASRVGSIGVVASFYVDENVIDVTSTNAPKKRPDVSTPQGKADVVEQLDGIHNLFVDGIAMGRGVTADKVNADFGRGATLLADEALKRGMIDKVSGVKLELASSSNRNTANSGGENMEAVMDLKELQAKHPAVYQAAVDLGKEQGVAGERDRVNAHITMGDSCGAMGVAVKAIQDGVGFNMTLQAEYMSAGRTKSDVDARNVDAAEVAAAVTGASTATESPERDAEISASILDAAFELCNVDRI